MAKKEALKAPMKQVYLFRLAKELGSGTIEGDDKFPKRFRLIPSAVAYLDDGSGNIAPKNVRYVRGETTLFPEDQRKEAKGTETYFELGWLAVRSIEPMLLKFLLTHPRNGSNEYRDKSLDPWFIEYVPEQQLKEFNVSTGEVVKAMAIIYDLFENDFPSLESWGTALGEPVGLPAEALLHNMLIRAQSEPKHCLAEMGNPGLRYKHWIKTAIAREIIRIDKNLVLWKDGSDTGFAANLNDDTLDAFIEWCMNDAKGKKIYASIKIRIENPLME